MDGMNIGELARRAGVQTSTVRYYEGLGLIAPPRRVSGWRRYEPTALARLQVIRAARDLGFSLDEIQVLLRNYTDDTPPAEMWRALAAKKLPEVQATIRRAEALELLLVNSSDCACDTVDECLETKCAPAQPQNDG
jgi:MerR family redox-sensitive transcriptional activator SoxR